MTSRALPRFVLDTNVCLDAFVFDDLQCASLLQAAMANEIVLVTRADCRAEWLSVLAYPRLMLNETQRANAAIAFDAYVSCMELDLIANAHAVALPRCRDRDDQKFLEAAWASDAIALLTRDNALLSLARRTKRAGLFAILQPGSWREAFISVE